MPKSTAKEASNTASDSLAGELIEVLNPATGEVFATAPNCREIQLEEAVQAGLQAYKHWRENEPNRRNALLNCSDLIGRNSEKIARLLTTEQGKPLIHSRKEVARAVSAFSYAANMDIPRIGLKGKDESRGLLQPKPCGVVGIIASCDFPIAIAAAKISRSLLLGNTVILKPSPSTPLACLLLAKILRKALPRGVLTVLTGTDELGSLMAQHVYVQKLSVSGTLSTGRSVMQVAAPSLKKLTLELGSNNPAIVLPDSDPKETGAKIARSAFHNSGQHCQAVRRVYVHESLHASLMDAMIESSRELRLGDGANPNTNLGPLTKPEQLQRIQELVDSVTKANGTLSSACESQSSRGFFCPPTFVTDIDPTHPLVLEEQLGPILPIIPFRFIEDAVAMANQGGPVISTSIWTKQKNLGLEVASWMNCDLVGIGDLPTNTMTLDSVNGQKLNTERSTQDLQGFQEVSENQIVEMF